MLALWFSMKDIMRAKTCLITGGTSGIGKATAQGLAEKGADVLLVARDKGKAERAVAEIKKETSNPQVDYLLADLSIQSNIHHLANEYLVKRSHLDVLINNAGGFFLRRKLNQDGIEMTFALNHLSYYLLTLLLLEKIKSSAVSRGEARIINVSSNGHYGKKMEFDNLQGERRYGPMEAYGRSKLANLYFTFELARRLDGSGVTANAVHPGWVATNIGRDNGWLIRMLMPLIQYNGLTPQEGARTNIFLARSEQAKGMSGKYFYKSKPGNYDPVADDADLAARLWKVSANMTGIQV